MVDVLSNSVYSSYWGSPTSGSLAITFISYFPDGTHKRCRTYVRGDNPTFDWVTDCYTSNCDPTYSHADLTGVLTHEMGHWWGLFDVGPPYNNASIAACDSVTMWGVGLECGTFQITPEFWDIQGIEHLYDAPTEVSYAFTASPATAGDTLRWEESDPSRSYTYQILSSDACWGPYALLGSFDSHDLSVTSDNRHYQWTVPATYNRAYYYELNVPGVTTGYTTSARTQGTSSTPPSTPTNTSATVSTSEGGVQISWTASAGTVTGYYLYRDWVHLTDCATVRQRYPTAPPVIFGPLTGTSFLDQTPPSTDSVFYYVRQ